jgi:hypothetical protein
MLARWKDQLSILQRSEEMAARPAFKQISPILNIT